MEWRSRRSPVYATHGVVASTQPLASEIGLRILQNGGNAADAAVAVAAALNVTQPTSTGIGGDVFALFFDAKTKTVRGLNSSGRAPKALSIEYLAALGITAISPWEATHALTVTVPGAAAGWCDTVERFGSGKMTIDEILEPAIALAREGFPVGRITAHAWKNSEGLLKKQRYGAAMLIDGRAPREGEIMRMPDLAETFEILAKEGKKGFYEGAVAKDICDIVRECGGVLSLDDLKGHRSTFDEPISVNYRGVDIFEIPPSGQGITALMALKILEGFEVGSLEHNSSEHLHLVIESLRLAFRHYVSDPAFGKVPVAGMLSKAYADERRKIINPQRAANIVHGAPESYSSTVYFCVVDGEGNACSFINSNYMGFGTGIIPKGRGFTLQNRGFNFNLEEGHANALTPLKRPYHTIIPGMALKDGELLSPFGVMGGFMQALSSLTPQGHLQVISNMVDFGMDPQQALDAPRICIDGGTEKGLILCEEGITQETIHSLTNKGHNVLCGYDRSSFGCGQIITRDPQTGVLCGGSDPRHDGHAVGY